VGAKSLPRIDTQVRRKRRRRREVTCRRWVAVSKDTDRDVIAIVVVLAAAGAPLGCSSEGGPSYGARRSVYAVAIVAARITSPGTITGPTGTAGNRITRAPGPTGDGVRRCTRAA